MGEEPAPSWLPGALKNKVQRNAARLYKVQKHAYSMLFLNELDPLFHRGRGAKKWFEPSARKCFVSHTTSSDVVRCFAFGWPLFACCRVEPICGEKRFGEALDIVNVRGWYT